MRNEENQSSEPAKGVPLPLVAKIHCLLFPAAVPSVFAALHLWPQEDASRHSKPLPLSSYIYSG